MIAVSHRSSRDGSSVRADAAGPLARSIADLMTSESSNGRLAAGHLEQHDAERIEVRRSGHRIAGELLGRHVAERSGDADRVLTRIASRRRRCCPDSSARHAEVGDDGAHARADWHQDHVGALEVGVDDAGPMRGLQSLRELDRDRERLVRASAVRRGCDRRACARAAAPSRRTASDALRIGCDGCRPRRCGTRWDASPCARSRSLSETAARTQLVAGQVGAQGLDRDVFVQQQIVRLVHLAHAAAADQLFDAVAIRRSRRPLRGCA